MSAGDKSTELLIRDKSILTFNFSVANRKLLSEYHEPFQIMPATQNLVQDKDIEKYVDISNPNILIHMNYITRMFSSKALEKGTMIRHSLRQYHKLADKIGTKDILIHMPQSLMEWNNFELGFRSIYEELIKDTDLVIHFEITAWSKDLHTFFETLPSKSATKKVSSRKSKAKKTDTVELDLSQYGFVPPASTNNRLVTVTEYEDVNFDEDDDIKPMKASNEIEIDLSNLTLDELNDMLKEEMKTVNRFSDFNIPEPTPATVSIRPPISGINTSELTPSYHAIVKYYNRLFELCKLNNVSSSQIKIVLDTAHLFANGCTENDMVALFDKYHARMKYCHFNGNINPRYSHDSHVPMFDRENLMTYDLLTKTISKLKIICVAEVTKNNANWKNWETFAAKYRLHLVEFNDAASA